MPTSPSSWRLSSPAIYLRSFFAQFKLSNFQKKKKNARFCLTAFFFSCQARIKKRTFGSWEFLNARNRGEKHNDRKTPSVWDRKVHCQSKVRYFNSTVVLTGLVVKKKKRMTSFWLGFIVVCIYCLNPPTWLQDVPLWRVPPRGSAQGLTDFRRYAG